PRRRPPGVGLLALLGAPTPRCPGRRRAMSFLERLLTGSGPAAAADPTPPAQALLQEQGDQRTNPAFTPPLRLAPDAAAYRGRGLAYEEEGKYAQAVADYTEAIRLDPRAADAYLHRGDAYFAQDDFDQAITDYDEAICLDPSLAVAYQHRGLAHA